MSRNFFGSLTVRQLWSKLNDNDAFLGYEYHIRSVENDNTIYDIKLYSHLDQPLIYNSKVSLLPLIRGIDKSLIYDLIILPNPILIFPPNIKEGKYLYFFEDRYREYDSSLTLTKYNDNIVCDGNIEIGFYRVQEIRPVTITFDKGIITQVIIDGMGYIHKGKYNFDRFTGMINQVDVVFNRGPEFNKSDKYQGLHRVIMNFEDNRLKTFEIYREVSSKIQSENIDFVFCTIDNGYAKYVCNEKHYSSRKITGTTIIGKDHDDIYDIPFNLNNNIGIIVQEERFNTALFIKYDYYNNSNLKDGPNMENHQYYKGTENDFKSYTIKDWFFMGQRVDIDDYVKLFSKLRKLIYKYITIPHLVESILKYSHYGDTYIEYLKLIMHDISSTSVPHNNKVVVLNDNLYAHNQINDLIKVMDGKYNTSKLITGVDQSKTKRRGRFQRGR